MRIIVDTALNTGAAEYSNLGDVSMLQVSVTRLRKLWPLASIEVLTESPANLATFCPNAKPLPRPGRDLWIGGNAMLGGFERSLPPAISAGFSRISRALRLHCPAVFRRLMYVRLGIRDRRNVRPELDAFLEAMKHADLFVVCGAGGFTDATRDWSMSTLNTVEEAIQRQVPVAMFGQGLGPLTDVYVQRRARRVLPKDTSQRPQTLSKHSDRNLALNRFFHCVERRHAPISSGIGESTGSAYHKRSEER